MIVYFVLRRQRGSLGPFLKNWAPQLASRFRFVFYDELHALGSVPRGTYVFTNVDLLTRPQRGLAVELCDQLSAADPPPRILNHPGRVLGRYELLRELHQRGVNPFRVYRISETRTPENYPVFLRFENDHRGPWTPLLFSRREVDRELARAYLRGLDLSRLIMVEFCDTSDSLGVFRKFSAWIVGEDLVPEGIFFGRSWALKFGGSEPLDAERMAEVQRYREDNPHKAQLLEVANLAHMDYARVDYGVVGDDVRIWELNSNAIPASPPGVTREAEASMNVLFWRDLAAAFERLAGEDDPREISIALGARPGAFAGRGGRRRRLKRLLPPAVLSRAEAAALAFPGPVVRLAERKLARLRLACAGGG